MREASSVKRAPVIPIFLEAILKYGQHLVRFKDERYAPFTILENSWFLPELRAAITKDIYTPTFSKNLFNLSPGKALQILQGYHASASGVFEINNIFEIFPFLSQPVFETALSIPTYNSFNERWTRVNFRSAVSKHYKTEHVWRQSKGEVSGLIQIFFQKELKRIKELCLEGIFASNKLVDKNLLNKHINLMANGQLLDLWLVLRLLSAELWFEAWSIS